MIQEINYTKLSLAAMFKLYNEHAAKLDEPRLRKRPDDRVEMARLLALLMTIRKKPVGVVRDVVIEELCRVAHYRNTTGKEVSDTPKRGYMAVGYSYEDVLLAIRSRLPNHRISLDAVQLHATNIRKQKRGYRKAVLPEKRIRKETK
jgi:hypothetical protein